jgi:hypothetical protein
MRISRSTTLLFATVVAALSASAAIAQAPKAESQKTEVDPAIAAVAAIDARLHSPLEAGLSALTFDYAPSSSDPTLVDFRVRLKWRKGEEPVVDFLDSEGKPLDRATPHPLLDSPDPERAGKKLSESYEAGAKAFLKLAFTPPTYAERFKDWRKRLDVAVVNGREERTLVFEPVTPGAFRRVEIRLGDDGMPERVKQYLTRPAHGSDVVVLTPVFETFGDRLLMTSFKEEVAGRIDQVVLEYRRIDGLYLPATYERILSGSKLGGSKTTFERLEIEKKAP